MVGCSFKQTNKTNKEINKQTIGMYSSFTLTPTFDDLLMIMFPFELLRR